MQIIKLKKIKTVYAFEPQIEIFNILNKNLKKYRNVKKYNIALDFKNRNKRIYINKLTSTSTMKINNKKSFYSKIKKIMKHMLTKQTTKECICFYLFFFE